MYIIRSCSHPCPSSIFSSICLKDVSVLPINDSIKALGADGVNFLGGRTKSPPSNSLNLSKSTSAGATCSSGSTRDGGEVLWLWVPIGRRTLAASAVTAGSAANSCSAHRRLSLPATGIQSSLATGSVRNQ